MPETRDAPSQRMLSNAADHRNAFTSPLPATVDRPGPVGLRRHSRWQRLPERRGLRPLALAQLEQPAPVSPGVALRRQRPDKPLPDRTGRNPLLRSIAPVGADLVAFRPPGPCGGSNPQRGPDHCHRHQRSTAVAPSPWPGTSGTPTSPAPGWTPPWNCCKPWPQRYPRI